MSKKIVTAAVSAVIAMGIATQTIAADNTTMKHHKMMKGMEKCFGITKAGKNDCGSAEQACAGSAKIDNDKSAWIAVPKGTCDKIVGGSTQAPKS